MGAFDRDYAFGADVKPTRYVDPPATFMGIVRPDGRVATRNYIGLLSTVNCSATVVRGIADAFRGDALDGVSRRRRRRRADARLRLRHGHPRRRHEAPAAHARRLRAARELRRRARRRPRLRGEPDQLALRRGEPAGRPAAAHVQHPGHRRHGEDDRARRRHRARDAAARERRHARSRCRRRTSPSACSAADPTAIPASPPIPRSARRSICWCATAARRSCPRRPRSTAPSTC